MNQTATDVLPWWSKCDESIVGQILIEVDNYWLYYWTMILAVLLGSMFCTLVRSSGPRSAS